MATSTCYPSTTANVADTGNAWGTPNNAQTSNNTYTACTFEADNQSDKLVCTNYGFNIPVGATITAVSVLVEIKADSAVPAGLTGTLQGATGQAADALTIPSLTTSDQVVELIVDLSVDAVTVVQANNSAFGVELFLTGDPGSGVVTYSIDSVAITVTYTAAANTGGFTMNVMRAVSPSLMAINDAEEERMRRWGR